MAKICMLTTVHKPFDTRIFHKESRTLAKMGFKVILIAQHDKNEIIDNIQIVSLKTPRNRIYRILFLPWQVFKLAFYQQAEIYHFHDPELLPIGILLKIFSGGKIIYDVHEDFPQDILTKYWIPSKLRKPIALLFNFWEKSAAKFLDALVVATERIAEKFKGQNPIIIHNYPDLEMLPDFPRNFVKGTENSIIYVGAISEVRGAFEMVRSLEYLDASINIRLDIIGRFEPSSLECRLQELPSYHKVRYLGWLSWKEAWQQSQGAMAGLVLFHPGPNHTRSLPNKLFEYMASKLPIISSDFPLWREIVEGNHCGLTVDPLNPKKIAETIQYLAINPEEAKRMGENGRAAVVKKFNWYEEGTKLHKLYIELINR